MGEMTVGSIAKHVTDTNWSNPVVRQIEECVKAGKTAEAAALVFKAMAYSALDSLRELVWAGLAVPLTIGYWVGIASTKPIPPLVRLLRSLGHVTEFMALACNFPFVVAYPTIVCQLHRNLHLLGDKTPSHGPSTVDSQPSAETTAPSHVTTAWHAISHYADLILSGKDLRFTTAALAALASTGYVLGNLLRPQAIIPPNQPESVVDDLPVFEPHNITPPPAFDPNFSRSNMTGTAQWLWDQTTCLERPEVPLNQSLILRDSLNATHKQFHSYWVDAQNSSAAQNSGTANSQVPVQHQPLSLEGIISVLTSIGSLGLLALAVYQHKMLINNSMKLVNFVSSAFVSCKTRIAQATNRGGGTPSSQIGNRRVQKNRGSAQPPRRSGSRSSVAKNRRNWKTRLWKWVCCRK